MDPQAEGRLGEEAKGGWLGWLIASSVAIAAGQHAIDADGRQLLLLKGAPYSSIASSIAGVAPMEPS